MDKNMTKKDKRNKSRGARKTLRAGALVALVAVGVGAMAGMAVMNAGSKPRRDMKWYVHGKGVEVAAPPVGEGYAGDGGGSASTTARSGAEILAGRRGAQTQTSETAEHTLEPSEAAEDTAEAPTEAPGGGLAEAAVEAVPEEEVPQGPVSITITAAGDCTFGGEVGSKGRRRFLDLAETNGNDYFFRNVRSLFEADDLTIVNLEGPLTSRTKTGKHGFVFKGDPSYVGILSGSGVELCNLANNHSHDYGSGGLKDTVKALEKDGVGYCGYSWVFNRTIKGVRVRALGFDWWSYNKSSIAKAVAQARDGCDLLIVNMHWGEEGHREQNARQVSIGHAIIDAGADLVIGTHPHVYQGVEKYKGKYIVYSLGNFCFAGNANPGDKRCLVFQQTFGFNPGLRLAQANIEDEGINIIPCAISSVKDKNDFQPILLPADEGGELLKAVASRSSNFTLAGTRWMEGNYIESNGLLNAAQDAGAGTAEAPAEDAAEEPAAGEPLLDETLLALCGSQV